MTSLRDAIIGQEPSDDGNAPKAHDEVLGDELTQRAEAGPVFANLPRSWRKPLFKGVYTPDEAIAVLNSHFMVGKSDQETAIFRINEDRSITFLPPDQFKLEVQNIRVEISKGKFIPAEKFWKESARRLEKRIVFKPGGAAAPNEFNLWGGFGVAPRETRRRIQSLLRHIWKVLCREDKAKFKYLIRWLAWAVQNPDKHPGTIIVLKSRKQGTGKSTLGVVMLKIFGAHGASIDDSERLLGRFNDWIEPICFILAEEILWAGDHKTTDKLKSRITADTFQIERKHGGTRQIPNRLHCLMTTNHDHAVSAGVRERRNFVLDADDSKAGDKSWFDRIYRDLDAGGYGEFLHFLQNVQLGDWHPREILKTAETTEQQRMSGDSITQWSQACVDADAIIASGNHLGPQHQNLAQRLASEDLRAAYNGYCKQQGLRSANQAVFGKACREMFGPRQRLPPTPVTVTNPAQVQSPPQSRPWGYDVPNGQTWQDKIDERLGIKN